MTGQEASTSAFSSTAVGTSTRIIVAPSIPQTEVVGPKALVVAVPVAVPDLFERASQTRANMAEDGCCRTSCHTPRRLLVPDELKGVGVWVASGVERSGRQGGGITVLHADLAGLVGAAQLGHLARADLTRDAVRLQDRVQCPDRAHEGLEVILV